MDEPTAWLTADPLGRRLLGDTLPVELVAELVERAAIMEEGGPMPRREAEMTATGGDCA